MDARGHTSNNIFLRGENGDQKGEKSGRGGAGVRGQKKEGGQENEGIRGKGKER